MRTPTVLSTTPTNYAVDVSPTSAIHVDFSLDIDVNTLKENMYLTDSKGNKVDGRVSYRKRRASFIPLQPLSLGTSYQLFLIGDTNVTDQEAKGIRTIIGEALVGNTVITFTTEADRSLQPPIITYPANASIIRQEPVIKWDAVQGATKYELQIAKSNIFENATSFEVNDVLIEPTFLWEDGIYYLRIRSYNEKGQSDWSSTFQFNLHTTKEGPIAEDDTPDVDSTDPYQVISDPLDFELELIQTFPDNLATEIPLNVKSLYFRVIGDIDTSLLDTESFTLTGKHITGDKEEISHGKVSGKTTIIEDKDGTTYIVFTPDKLLSEDEQVGES